MARRRSPARGPAPPPVRHRRGRPRCWRPGCRPAPAPAVGPVVFDPPGRWPRGPRGEAPVAGPGRDLPGRPRGDHRRRGGRDRTRRAHVPRGRRRAWSRQDVRDVRGGACSSTRAAVAPSRPTGVVIREGDVRLGRRHQRSGLPRGPRGVARARSPRALDGDAGGRGRHALVQAVTALLESRRRAAARCASAPTRRREADALLARRLGAEGIGLCRTEHMLLGPRRELVERVVVDDRRDEALARDRGAGRSRVRRPPARHGRTARRGPAARPSAARVPARPRRAHDRGRAPGRATRVRRGPGRPVGHREEVARDQPDARAARCPPADGGPRARRRARARAGRSAPRRLRAEGLDPHPEIMVPLVAVETELALADDAHRGRPARTPGPPAHPCGDDDRAAQGRPHRRRARTTGRVLLVRHQRPDPDHLGDLPRRRRGQLPAAYRAKGCSPPTRSRPSTRTGWASW